MRHTRHLDSEPCSLRLVCKPKRVAGVQELQEFRGAGVQEATLVVSRYWRRSTASRVKIFIEGNRLITIHRAESRRLILQLPQLLTSSICMSENGETKTQFQTSFAICH